jgi:threonine dehydratase
VHDQPGALAQLADRIARTGANILQISHTRGFGQIAIGETEIELILETTGPAHVEEIYRSLVKHKFKIKEG